MTSLPDVAQSQPASTGDTPLFDEVVAEHGDPTSPSVQG